MNFEVFLNGTQDCVCAGNLYIVSAINATPMYSRALKKG